MWPNTNIATVQDSKWDSSEFYILLDTDCSDSILSNNYLSLLYSIRRSKSPYSTTRGLYKVNKHVKVKFKMPRFSSSKVITWTMEIGDLREVEYDIIIGRDLMKYLGIFIEFKQ